MAFGNSQAGDNEPDEFAPLVDINVTPFIDVMLVLLIIFMITAPMLATGVKLDLPKARTARPLDNQKPIVITISSEGALQVGERTVAVDTIVATVRSELGGDDRVIQLRGDHAARYGLVVSVLETCWPRPA